MRPSSLKAGKQPCTQNTVDVINILSSDKEDNGTAESILIIFKKGMHIKHLEQCLAHRKYYSINFYYSFVTNKHKGLKKKANKNRVVLNIWLVYYF